MRPASATAVTDLDRRLAAMRAHRWEIVRLRGKKPIGRHWQVTKDPTEVATWIHGGDNIGLVCHQRTGVAVLDPDELLGWADMIDDLGQPSLPWVITGSGKLHYYIRWEPKLPAKLVWKGETIGEIQRGPGQQQVVLPPSIHPTTRRPYRWITESLGGLVEPIDPGGPLPRIEGLWLAWFYRTPIVREQP